MVFRNFEGKKIERKSEKIKIKNRLKNNLLFLYVFLNLYNLFFSIVLRLNNFKLHKFLTDFNYICFFYSKIKYEKIIFLNNFFIFFIVYGNQTY